MRSIYFAALLAITSIETGAVLVSNSHFRSRTRSSFDSQTVCCAAISNTGSADKARTSRNPNARRIIDFIQSRFDTDTETGTAANGAAPTWTKTQNYIYRAGDGLTMSQVEAVLSFLDQEFPNDEALVQSVVTMSPRILRKNVQTYLQPTANFLKSLYGPDMFREAISRNPGLLLVRGIGYAAPNHEMEEYLTNDLRFSKDSIRKLKRSAPFLLRVSMEKIRNDVAFFTSILEKGGCDQQEQSRVLEKLILLHPHLMNLCVQTNLEPRIRFLKERCDLNDRDVATIVKSSPAILGLSVDDNLRPTLDFLAKLLSDDVGEVSLSNIRKCIMAHPQLLALSLTNLRAKVDYFCAIDQQSQTGSSLASRIAIRSPSVYSLSLKENIIPTVQFLAKAWGTHAPVWDTDDVLGREGPGVVTTESLGTLLKEYPAVLTFSLEGNIQPTLNFYNRTGYTSLDKDWRLQNGSKGSVRGGRIGGRYIAASLFNRLLPRWHLLIANGWPLSQGEGPDISKLPPLNLLVMTTDRAFCEQIGFDADKYVEFKDEVVPRLKFSSQFDTWVKTGRPIDVGPLI